MNLNPLQYGLTPVQQENTLPTPFSNASDMKLYGTQPYVEALNQYATGNASPYYDDYNPRKEDMSAYGWNTAQNTPYLATYRNGNKAGTFTPIINEDGDFFTKSQMSHYADDVLGGRYDDYLNLMTTANHISPNGEEAYNTLKQDASKVAYLNQLYAEAKKYVAQHPNNSYYDYQGSINPYEYRRWDTGNTPVGDYIDNIPHDDMAIDSETLEKHRGANYLNDLGDYREVEDEGFLPKLKDAIKGRAILNSLPSKSL